MTSRAAWSWQILSAFPSLSEYKFKMATRKALSICVFVADAWTLSSTKGLLVASPSQQLFPALKILAAAESMVAR